MIVSQIDVDRVRHAGGDHVVGAEQLVLEINDDLGGKVVAVERHLQGAVVDVAGQGLLAGSEVGDLTSESELDVSGGEHQAKFSVNLLFNSSKLKKCLFLFIFLFKFKHSKCNKKTRLSVQKPSDWENLCMGFLGDDWTPMINFQIG